MAGRFAFVVNPRAGPQDSSRHGLAARVKAAASAAGLSAVVVETEGRGHAETLASELSRQGYEVVAAVGGDGTVNEVARGLLAGDAALAIVPLGSGNGFARDFDISLELGAACRQIGGGSACRIDVGEVDGRPFLMTAGFGIDARICHEYDRRARRRGMLAYVRIGLGALRTYRPPPLVLVASGVRRELHPLLLVAANTRQFGGGAVIAGEARPDDGLLDFVVVPPMPAWRLPFAALCLFRPRLGAIPGLEVIRVAEAEVLGEGPIEAQVDGEPVTLPARVVVRTIPGALKLWRPAPRSGR